MAFSTRLITLIHDPDTSRVNLTTVYDSFVVHGGKESAGRVSVESLNPVWAEAHGPADVLHM